MLIPLILFLAACGSGLDENEARRVATQAALGTPPPAKYQTAAAIYLQLTLTPTPVPPTATRVTVIDFAATMAANEMISMLTKQAGEAEAEKARLAAEQAKINATQYANSLNATMTADARTAQAFSAQQTAQAVETRQASTAFYQATASQQAFVVGQQNTAVARDATARVQPTTDLWTATAIAQEIAIKQGEVEDVNLAVKRQTAKNMFDALLPWTLTVVGAYVLGRGFQTWVKTRTHPRDEHGRPQTFQRELSDGGVVLVKPEQLETGIIKVGADGSIVRYEPIDKHEQSDINRRAQITDAIAALPMPYARNAQGMMRTEFGGGQMGTPSVQILNEARALSPVLDEAEAKLVEE